MPTDATTIYNRAGTVHTWHYEKTSRTAPTVMRSLCGLSELLENLQNDASGPRCKKCAARNGKWDGAK